MRAPRLTIREAAEQYGITERRLRFWSIDVPDLADRSNGRVYLIEPVLQRVILERGLEPKYHQITGTRV